MALDKTLLAGSSATLVLKLLDGRDMYGYQIIEELACRSNNVFQMKAGTLYPLLHGLEKKGLLEYSSAVSKILEGGLCCECF